MGRIFILKNETKHNYEIWVVLIFYKRRSMEKDVENIENEQIDEELCLLFTD